MDRYKCQNCGYSQDFQPTKEKMEKIFNDDPYFKLNNIKEDECPSCALSGIRGNKLIKN